MRGLVDRVWFYGKKSPAGELISCLFWAVVSTFWDDTKQWLDHCQWVDD